MAEFFADSAMAYPREMALFSKLIQNVGIKKARSVEFLPTSEFSSTGIITFNIPSAGSFYIDLNKTFLIIRAKIVYKDGHPLPKLRKERTGAWIYSKGKDEVV